ncbi:MAG TPA: class E sortase [Candidatus Andersenbacteria bacterium]|nr:class E sortase [Candidatus Andersenbacteria bacterium]
MKNPVILFITTLIFAFLFLYGVISSIQTFGPFLVASLTVQEQPKQFPQLPLSPDRTVPFATVAAAPVVIHPYPIQDPLDPPFSLSDAGKNLIRIPAINVDIPIVESKTLADSDVLAALQFGAALYPNGVEPGALGNVFIAAHSTGNPWQGKYRFAFTRINELKAGDIIMLDWHGTRYTYKIYKSETIVPTPGYTVASDRPYPTMSLMACWPLWSTSHRILVHADLTNITQLNPRK